MLARDGHVVHSKCPDYSYEGFNEFPVPGHAQLGENARDRWSTRLTTILRRKTPHPHVKDLPSLMRDVLRKGDQPLTLQRIREILGGNHHFRVRPLGEGKQVVHMVVGTEGPEPHVCKQCAEEERWHGAARRREDEKTAENQRRGRMHRHGPCSSPAAGVDYSQLFETQPEEGRAEAVARA
jgi:hypothetical protein